jgi:GAF domain-containing protein
VLIIYRKNDGLVCSISGTNSLLPEGPPFEAEVQNAIRKYGGTPDDYDEARRSFIEGLRMVLGKRGSDLTRICILEPKEGSLMITESVGYSAEGVANLVLPIHDSVAGECFECRRSRYVPDRRKEKGYKENPRRKRDYLSIACFPIECSGYIFGVLNIDAIPEKAFSENELKIMDLITGLLGLSYILERRVGCAEVERYRREAASTKTDT